MPNISDVRIRLQRFGRRHKAVYRIVVAHHYAPRDGKYIELLGNYSPHADALRGKHVRLNVSRFQHWVANGASPTETVARIASKFNLLPPQPIRLPIALKDIKPELVPKPTMPQQPTLNTYAERHYSTVAHGGLLRAMISGSGYTIGASPASIAAPKRGLFF